VHYTPRDSGVQDTPSLPRGDKTNFRHAEHGGGLALKNIDSTTPRIVTLSALCQAGLAVDCPNLTLAFLAPNRRAI